MSLSYVIAIANSTTLDVKYFMQFDIIGNVITTNSVFSAFNFGADKSSAQYVCNHVLREFALTGESRDYIVSALDVYIKSDIES